MDVQGARSIRGLTRSEANYNSVINLSHKCFGKAENIISKHMDKMFKIPGWVSNKASQIWLVSDRLSINIHGFESLGVSSRQYGNFLIPVIMLKLPPEVRIQVARNTACKVWEMSVIPQEVEAYETSNGFKRNMNNKTGISWLLQPCYLKMVRDLHLEEIKSNAFTVVVFIKVFACIIGQGCPKSWNARKPESRKAGKPESWNAGMPEIKTRKS